MPLLSINLSGSTSMIYAWGLTSIVPGLTTVTVMDFWSDPPGPTQVSV
jgi:hypothetical protein